MPAPTTSAMLYAKRHPSDATVIVFEIPGVPFTGHTERTTYQSGPSLWATREHFAVLHAGGLIDDVQIMIELLKIKGVKRICMEQNRLEVHSIGTAGHLKIARAVREVLNQLVESNLALNHASIG